VFLALYQLVDHPFNALAISLHRARDLPLEVPDIAAHVLLQRLIATTHAHEHLLAHNLTVYDLDANQIVGGLHVLHRQIVSFAQTLDRPDDLHFYWSSCWQSGSQPLVVAFKVSLQLVQLVGVVGIGRLVVALI